jgi:hypothetical protein
MTMTMPPRIPTTMTTVPPGQNLESKPIHRLGKRLWTGIFLLNFFLLAGTALYRPGWLPLATSGVLLGAFYLWSLLENAKHPKRGIQSAFSLIRMVALAWLAVHLSHGRLSELALVMSGLLSYKMVLMVEYVLQALPAFLPEKSARDVRLRPQA